MIKGSPENCMKQHLTPDRVVKLKIEGYRLRHRKAETYGVLDYLYIYISIRKLYHGRTIWMNVADYGHLIRFLGRPRVALPGAWPFG